MKEEILIFPFISRDDYLFEAEEGYKPVFEVYPDDTEKYFAVVAPKELGGMLSARLGLERGLQDSRDMICAMCFALQHLWEIKGLNDAGYDLHYFYCDHIKVTKLPDGAWGRADMPIPVKLPLTLSDLTEEQAIQIAKLAIGEGMAAHSTGFAAKIHHVRARVSCKFHNTSILGSEPSYISVDIYPDFTVQVAGRDNYDGVRRSMSTRNQRVIQKLFKEWGAE